MSPLHAAAWCVTALLAVVPPAVSAAPVTTPRRPIDSPDTAVVQLPLEMIVTASRQSIPLRECPAATSVVGKEQLARMPRGVSVSEALVSVPGVRIDNPADGERVHLSIRGQGILAERGIRGTRTILDGLPLNDPSGVAPDLYDVDWATVGSVEVLRGPAGAWYGGAGAGGAVDIRTADGADRLLAPRVSVTGGTYGFHKELAEVGGTGQDMNYRVSLSQAAGDGYREHNAFHSDHVYGKFRWTPNPRLDVQPVFAWSDEYEQNAEGLNAQQVQEDPRQANPDAIPYDEYYHTARFSSGVVSRITTAPDQTLRLAAYFRATQYEEPRPRELQRRGYQTPGVSAQYDWDLGTGRVTNHVSVGTDLAWQFINELRFDNPGAATQDSLLANANIFQLGVGVFGIDRIELTRAWTLMLSGRFDDIDHELHDHPFKGNPDLSGSKHFHRTTGRVGLAWSPTPRLGVYGNWGQGFLPPTTEELVNNPVTYGGFNQDLVPATSAGGELGVRGLLATGLSYELSGFVLDTRDDFDRYRISSRPGLTFYRNSGDSRRYGLETRLGWNPVRRLTANVAYTWSHFRYTAPDTLDGHELPNSPAHMMSLDVAYELAPRLTVGIETTMQSDWQVDPENSATVAGFALWGARLAYRWRLAGWEGDVTVAGRNVFGASYMAFTEPDPDGNSYQPGPRQAVYAGITAGW